MTNLNKIIAVTGDNKQAKISFANAFYENANKNLQYKTMRFNISDIIKKWLLDYDVPDDIASSHSLSVNNAVLRIFTEGCFLKMTLTNIIAENYDHQMQYNEPVLLLFDDDDDNNISKLLLTPTFKRLITKANADRIIANVTDKTCSIMKNTIQIVWNNATDKNILIDNFSNDVINNSPRIRYDVKDNKKTLPIDKNGYIMLEKASDYSLAHSIANKQNRNIKLFDINSSLTMSVMMYFINRGYRTKIEMNDIEPKRICIYIEKY